MSALARRIIPRRRISAGLMIFLSAFLFYLLTLNSVWATDHATSFLQLDWSIWTQHTFVLGSGTGFQPNTVDDFLFNGNYYSALAPGTAILALPFAGVGFMLDGHFTVFGYALDVLRGLRRPRQRRGRLSRLRCREALLQQEDFGLPGVRLRLLDYQLAFRHVLLPERRHGHVRPARGLLHNQCHPRRPREAPRRRLRRSLGGRGADDRLRERRYSSPSSRDTSSSRSAEVGDRSRESPLAFSWPPSSGYLLLGLYNEAIFGTAFHTTEQVYLNSSTPVRRVLHPLLPGGLS